MSVASRLRGVFALYIMLLAAVLIFHARTVQRALESGRRLAAISSRLRTTSGVQLARISEMTRLELEARQFVSAEGASAAVTVEAAGVERALEEVRTATRTFGEASQAAMTRELAESGRAARVAERVSLLAAAGTLLLSVLLCALLVRSIVQPIQRLALGTREISAGRFGHRLEAAVAAVDGSDEFGQVARDFNAMAERLGELDRMKREFVSNVSHDLKTPLSSMQETTGVLLDELPGPLSDKQKQLLSLNLESGHRLSDMIAKLLDLARLESVPVATYDVLDVAWLARTVIERANAAQAGRGGGPAVSLVEPGGRLLVRADADGIERLLDNLLENAIKFSPAGGTVRVTLADLRTRGAVLLSVADEGPGIPAAEKERVFERFHQTPAGRAVRSRGVGLGLSICRHIAQAHGGTIWVADNEPRGAVLCVLLPRSASGLNSASAA